MAESDFTQNTTHGKAYKEAADDTLTRKSAQLSAMLTTVVGEGFQSFDGYNAKVKENFLWACQDLADEINVLAELVTERGAQ
jgi:hypothetical protein